MAGRIIVTVLGKDKAGIVAEVSKKLNELNGNIIDITQTIFDDELFAMIMLVDGENSGVNFETFQKELMTVEDKIGVKIYAQHEEIFKTMHRI